MSKITNEQSREIYEIATSTDRKMSNVDLGKKFGISERAVRFHIKKWEAELHAISKTNAKAANALADHAVNVNAEAKAILAAVKESIVQAKINGISPEKLSGLYGNWIKSLELVSELLGDLNRAPQMNVQVNQQLNDFMNFVLEEVDDVTKSRIVTKLRQAVISKGTLQA